MADAQEVTADSLKAKGNEEFKAGRYNPAIEAYTASLDLNPSQHLVFSNRSGAWLKLGGKADEALKDAERCVELSPEWPKGYHRMAAALQELSRWDDAAEACSRGLEAAPGDESLKKMRGEVLTRRFAERLRGPWHGTVHPEMGGYDQEMEFLDGFQVKITVMAKPVLGTYCLDCTKDPQHMDIQVRPDPSMFPPGAPMIPPPPMPHIVQLDGDEMKICCPFMTNGRPASYEGPGLCVMHRGVQPAKNFSEDLQNLTAEQKLVKCTEELLDILPNEKLEDPTPSDSEAVVGKKIQRSVKFQNDMYQLEIRFGEESMKEVFEAVRAISTSSPCSSALASHSELVDRLVAKLKVCGLWDNMPVPPPLAPAPAEPAAPRAVSGPPPPVKPSAPAASSDVVAECASSSGLTMWVVVLGAAAAVAAFAWSRRRKQS